MHFIAMIMMLLCCSNLDAKKNVVEQSNVKFTLWSGNCYAFPVKITSFLQGTTKFFGHEVNLVGGIDKDIEQRIIGIAELVLAKNPDVVVFQELWKNDNKELMSRKLRGVYPYIYWIPMSRFEELQVGKSVGKFFKTLFTDPAKLGKSETYVELNPLKMDSGLFVASKFPLLKTAYITYRDKGGDEVNAHKGALVILFNDRQGNPVLLAVTHLQSWRDLEYVKIRHQQIMQLGTFLASRDIQRTWGIEVSPPRTVQVQMVGEKSTQDVVVARENMALFDVPHLTTVVVGDFNDPITYQADGKRLLDRLTCFSETFARAKVPITCDALSTLLKQNLAIQEYVVINELSDNALVVNYSESRPPQRYTIYDASTKAKQGGATNSLYNVLGRFYESKDGKVLYDYFMYATDAKGRQLLDPLFLDAGSTIGNYQVLRKEILGDQGKDKPYDPTKALSDHAHIMVEIHSKK